MFNQQKPMIWTLIFLGLLIGNIHSASIQSGSFDIRIVEEHKDDIKHRVKLNNKINSQIELTQSSRINIEARIQFQPLSFRPQFFSFRLRHSQYENLSEPILAHYNSADQSYKATLDLGDPKQIKPFTSKYQLEVIIGDDQLGQKNIRTILADCNVVFRKSWQTLPLSDLHYRTEGIIETPAPAPRVDPPSVFTLFVILVILAVDGVFVYGLGHLKVNINLFPTSSTGFLTNTAFLGILFANFGVLMMFWINWTFLETLQFLLILILPTALIANYALVYVKRK